MPLPPVVIKQGYHYSHASFKTRFLGLLLEGVRELNYKCTVTRGEVRGHPREPLGHTIGDVAYEAGMTVLRSYWDAIKERARDTYGRAPMDVQGTVTFTISERGLPTKVVAIEINGLSEAGSTSSQGTDANEVPIVFTVLSVKEDGKALVDKAIT
jgi:hypothetical protein